MIVEEVGLLAAFLAGLFSFLSPCVLPLIPAYLSMITGLTIDELGSGNPYTGRVLLSCALFTLGFSLVFILMGAAASTAGRFLISYARTLNLVLAVLVGLMGLFISGLVKIPLLNREKRLGALGNIRSTRGPLAALVMGSAFALGWTPCVGPVLASILAYAAASNSTSKGVLLLSVYSLGLALPFVLSGLFFGRAVVAFDWIKRNQDKANAIAGAILMALAVLLVLDSFGVVTIFG
jgi:cytochrome c-type biogenesis protein